MTEDVQITVPVEVREKFDSRRGEGAYGRWLKRFVRSCNTFTQIGKDEGITHQAVRKTYNKYFAPYLPKKTGRERQKVCTLHTACVRYERAKHKFPTPALQEIAWQAKARGHTVSAIPRKDGSTQWNPRKYKLLINDMVCQVYHHRRKGLQNSVFTGVSGATFLQHSFHIFYLEVEGFDRVVYIIPKEILRDSPLCVDQQGRKVFNLRLIDKRDRRGRKPRVDWRQFRNAWHLLKVTE